MAAKTPVVHIAVGNAEVTASAGLPVELTGTSTVTAVGAAGNDDPVSGNPVLIAGYGSAAAPVPVSADGDVTRPWYSLNGAQCIQLTNAGALIPGNATDGLLVNLGTNNDVTVTGTITVDGSGVTQPVSGTVTANLAAGANNIGDVDILTVPAPLNVVGSGTEATALRVTVATNSTGVLSVTGAAAHDAAVSGNPVLIAGASSAAAPTDVSADGEVVRAWHLRNGASAVQVTAAGTLVGAGNGAAATALRVTVANDSTGVLAVTDNGGTLSIDDGAGSITVDGSVTVSGTTTTSDTATLVDNAGFTDGTSRVLTAGFIHDETPGTALTENDVAAARIDSKRAQIGVIEDGATRGRWATVTTGLALKIDGSAVTQPVSGTVTAGNTAGDIAHDGVDSGNPIKIGAQAVDFGVNPTAVAAADRTNLYATRGGIQFVLGGHPNIISAEYMTTGSQTNNLVVTAVGAGTRIVITQIMVISSAATTVSPQVRIGFGTANVPAEGSSGAVGVAKVVLSHPGIPPGSGIIKGNGAGIIGIGASDEDLFITCGAPTSGKLTVQVDYYTTVA